MKLLLMTLAMLFAINFSYAQNTYPWPSTGNIGIGTITPDGAYQLTLSGNGTSTPVAGISFKQGGNSGFFVGYPGATDNTNIELFNANNGYMRFATNNAERMRIDNNGNVGIGTTSPEKALDVVGVIRSTGDSNKGLYISSNYSNTNNRNWAIVNNYNSWGQLSFIQSTSNGGDPISGATARLNINVDGKIGIGTTTPDELLSVNGTIHATEIKVDLSVPAPDYVFEKSYKLKSLQEVAKYVAINKHLSEIPSAKMMEQNGVNVSELNMKLLQKVEELTLYLIEQKQEITELKEKQTNSKQQQIQIDQLKQQLQALTKEIRKN